MLFYNLGVTRAEDHHAIAIALAQLGRAGAVLSCSTSPCVCAGGQVNLDQEVNLGFCRARRIPVFRRDNRAATICFGQQQLELQVILERQHPLLAPRAVDNSRLVLAPLLQTCLDLGLSATQKSPTEILVGGRRIASACVGEVRQYWVLAASIALDFDADLFASVLHAHDRDVHTRIAELARTCRTSLREELGELPSLAVLERQVRMQLQLIFGGLRPAEVDPVLRAHMRDAAAVLSAPARLQAQGRVGQGWQVELGAGVALQQCGYKAPGGFLHATCEWHDGRLARASLGGDFFCYPPGALYRLEEALVGTRADQISRKVTEFYGKLGLVTPGVHALHWTKVLSPAGASLP